MNKLISSTFVILLFSLRIYAQFGSTGLVDAKSTAMAKSYTAASNGIYSIGVNPANLASSDSPFLQFSTVLPLPSISSIAGTDFMTINDFNYYFGGVNGNPRYLSQTDKERLNALFNNGGFVRLNASINWLSVALKINDKVGAIAFSINDVAAGKFTFPQAIVDIALNGNTIGKTYNLNDANISAWWIRDYSLSYARHLDLLKQYFDEVNAGVTLKIVQGFAYAGTEQINTNLSFANDYSISGSSDLSAVSSFSNVFNVKYDFDSTSQQTNFSPFPSPAGTGFGFDIGFSAKRHFWRFGLSITDIGSINWDNHAAQFTASGNVYLNDITNKTQVDSLKDQVFGKSKSISSFTTSLPTSLRLGASYFFDKRHNPIPGTLLLAADYNQGFNNMPGNSVNPRISVGGEWKPMDWIPYIRTGFSFGGNFGFHWAFGLGFRADMLEFNIATTDLQTLIAPNSSKYISVSIGSSWNL